VEPVIYAGDIGSIPQGNFGWARVDPEQGETHVEREHGGAEIRGLVAAVERDLFADGRQIAVGFECPLFVPVPQDPLRLGVAREGEGDRPFSATAGNWLSCQSSTMPGCVEGSARNSSRSYRLGLAWNIQTFSLVAGSAPASRS
jgi:hypothetical protein